MLFSAVTPRGIPLWQLVCEELKTQTRRPKKPGDIPFWDGRSENPDRILWVTSKNRLRYKVSQDYAVQPKRGQPAIRFVCGSVLATYYYPTIYPENPVHAFYLPYSAEARIQITAIRDEDVREISLNDAKAEGFSSQSEFWCAWLKLYAPKVFASIQCFAPRSTEEFKDIMMGYTHPEIFQAWALTFELRTGD